jgi:hypothetical protein
MFTNLDEFINRKFELIDKLRERIDTLESDLKTLDLGDNKEKLLIIRKELYSSLREQIPKTMGLGNERFREHRRNKINQFNKILEEFDTKYSITESDYFIKTL